MTNFLRPNLGDGTLSLLPHSTCQNNSHDSVQGRNSLPTVGEHCKGYVYWGGEIGANDVI
jgi:hypothetical protein